MRTTFYVVKFKPGKGSGQNGWADMNEWIPTLFKSKKEAEASQPADSLRFVEIFKVKLVRC